MSSARRATLGAPHPVILRALTESARISIGDDFGITGATICATNAVTIGDGVLVGCNVIIADTDFHPVDHGERRYADRPRASDRERVTIGNNVFLGTGSIVLKGTTIGDDCVIGAGSVVRGEVPSGTVYAGNPAELVRRLSTDKR